ncbi:hypothetical protein SD70_18065 [Gordoniibacillus kamchatkensis]|uniref:Uncharacterized protein n=1 Tax=Gordoniibacillus kamchatkensis TaxID=1590651 RepID=A0ABR5AGF5_9BACL|nr:hypothetical protein [Paenibacillus sp. VKM B-2647]KIL39798.1 hypothetical protein SD70_18065 [Paenibacillus sp. VKM B-2647]
MAGSKGGHKPKKKKEGASGRAQYTMRIVDSATCAVCKTPCARGLDYLARMSQPGAVGRGVPCILTRKRVN